MDNGDGKGDLNSDGENDSLEAVSKSLAILVRAINKGVCQCGRRRGKLSFCDAR